MDAILRRLDQKQAARTTMAPTKTEDPSPGELKAMEEARVAQEKHAQEIQAFKDRVAGHMRKLMASDHKWTQYPPLSTEHLYIVAQLAESVGLVSHEFGEEGIDRFIIVYKPEHQPDDEQLARMSLKHDQKLDDAAIERILHPLPEPEEVRPPVRRRGPREEEAEDSTPQELHAVGTVKRIRRNVADVISEVQARKARENNLSIDKLFEEKK